MIDSMRRAIPLRHDDRRATRARRYGQIEAGRDDGLAGTAAADYATGREQFHPGRDGLLHQHRRRRQRQIFGVDDGINAQSCDVGR